MAFKSATFILCLLIAIPRTLTAGEALDAAVMDEMHKQFSEAYNRADLDAMTATFAENAVRVTPSGVFQGRDAIRQSFSDALRRGLRGGAGRGAGARPGGAGGGGAGTGRA